VKVSDLNEQIAAMQANLVHDYKFTPENVYQLETPRIGKSSATWSKRFYCPEAGSTTLRLSLNSANEVWPVNPA
jgi:hypothetical protein